MASENSLPSYQSINTALAQQNVALTAAEMHGLLSGLLCGGCNDGTWVVMVHDLTNDGLAFGYPLGDLVKGLYEETKEELEEDGFSFEMLIPDDDDASIYERVDALGGWVNHFLLGLGMMQPKLGQVKGEVGEAITDLRNIAQLGYEEEDDPEELELSFEEIREYVRMAAMLCHTDFAKLSGSAPQNGKPTLH